MYTIKQDEDGWILINPDGEVVAIYDTEVDAQGNADRLNEKDNQ